MLSTVIDQHVSDICELGCTKVEEIITALQQGRIPGETAGLNAEERLQVLHELIAIMAVYLPRKGDKGCK